MKSTGVVRKIDELGRIVIPKEIRRTLHIRDGENLEILVDDAGIILKKYSKLADFSDKALKICEFVNQSYPFDVLISDRETIVASAGSFVSTLTTRDLDSSFLDLLQNHEAYASSEMEEHFGLLGYFLLQPIITSMDTLGLVIFFLKEHVSEEAKILCKFVAKLLAEQIDIA